MKVTAEYNLAKLHPNIAKEIFIPENEFKDSVFSDINRRSSNKPDSLIIGQNISKTLINRPIINKNGLFRLLPLISKNDIKKEGSCLCLT